jgi:hypothetical protein
MPDSDLLDGVESRPNTVSVKMIRYAKFFGRSNDAATRICNVTGKLDTRRTGNYIRTAWERAYSFSSQPSASFLKA